MLIAGCGNQVVVEGVDLNNKTLAGDSVIDTGIAEEGPPGEEGYAPGNPYQEDIEGEANLGPNAPGYIPESID